MRYNHSVAEDEPKRFTFGKDIHMTDFEIIMIVLSVMGLIISMDNHTRK